MGNMSILNVNFEEQFITLFKETRHFLWLNFAIPHTILNLAKDAKRVYPFAVSLREIIRTYRQTLAEFTVNTSAVTPQTSTTAPENSSNVILRQDIQLLTAAFHTQVQSLIRKGLNQQWDYFISIVLAGSNSNTGSGNEPVLTRGVTYVQDLVSSITAFQSKAIMARAILQEINENIEDLGSCPYDHESFAKILQSIQDLVDRINLESFANLGVWAVSLDRRIEEKLAKRLHEATLVVMFR